MLSSDDHEEEEEQQPAQRERERENLKGRVIDRMIILVQWNA